jgi:hypothetical protein
MVTATSTRSDLGGDVHRLVTPWSPVVDMVREATDSVGPYQDSFAHEKVALIAGC